LGDPFRYMMAKWIYGYSLPLRVIEKLGIKPGGDLLIIGSGIGETAILASKKKGYRVRGLEIYPQLVEQARRRVKEKGLSERLSFETLSEPSLKAPESYDALLFESILSFLPNPASLLSSAPNSLKKEGGIGIIELTYTKTPTPSEATYISSVFGGDFSPKSREEWTSLFKKLGLIEKIQETERIGLSKKFWDDFSASPISTLSALSKTIYSIYKNPKSKEAMRDFRTIMKRHSDKLARTYYILKKY